MHHLLKGTLRIIIIYDFSKFLYRWKHALFLVIDANFCLTRKNVSTEEKDPSLSDGWAFFVRNDQYKAHLKKYWNNPQPVSSIFA